jgi:hypothetical protein
LLVACLIRKFLSDDPRLLINAGLIRILMTTGASRPLEEQPA